MRIRLLGLFGAIAVLLTWPASGVAAGGATRLLLAPAHPHATSALRFDFVQPQIAAGATPGQSTESLAVDGPAGPGCASDAAQAIAGAAVGSRVRTALRPSRADGDRWCVGAYRATLVLTRSSGCPIGNRLRICPQFVVAPTVVATTRFRITAG